MSCPCQGANTEQTSSQVGGLQARLIVFGTRLGPDGTWVEGNQPANNSTAEDQQTNGSLNTGLC
jgi:hypothetical protein